MRLYELFASLDLEIQQTDCLITGICADSRLIESGNIYVCMREIAQDGAAFVKEAVAKGASLIVCMQDAGINNQYICSNPRALYAKLTAALYGNPEKKLIMIGVTGTNGKTTVATMIKGILDSLGHKTGLLGTIEAQIGEKRFPAKHTTPDPKTLYALLDIMVKEGCTHCVMEVSSHGLHQERVAGIAFRVGVFTNLTKDHLDYHQTMENYYQAKKMLFKQVENAIINVDCPYGKRLFSELACKSTTYSTGADTGDLYAFDIAQSLSKTIFTARQGNMQYTGSIPMAGEYAVANGLAAIATCQPLGIDTQILFYALSAYKGVSGRMEILYSKEYTIIRDYAHTPDGLEKLLLAIKAITKGKVIILFGCAGNRDKTKRSEMAQIASRLSDFVILTSDNPRNEDVLAIINDTKVGLLCTEENYVIIPDRYKAIEWGIQNICAGDTLVLAGKGHENYQVLDFGTIHFDEKEIVEELLAVHQSGQ